MNFVNAPYGESQMQLGLGSAECDRVRLCDRSVRMVRDQRCAGGGGYFVGLGDESNPVSVGRAGDGLSFEA